MLACGSFGWMRGFEYVEKGQGMGEEKQWGVQMPGEQEALLRVLTEAGIQGKSLVPKWAAVKAGVRHMLTKMLI